MLDKQELRKRFFKIRDLIDDREYKEQKICNLLKSLNLKKKSVISGYYPIKNEVNILPFLEFLKKKKIIICLPSIEKEKSHLLFKKWKFGDKLIKGKFMINEPDHNEFIEPSILIVPMLAFDKNKNRLGYGGGFYDRTINFLEKKNKIKSIGVAFFQQNFEEVPTMYFDRKLDMIVTDNGIIK